MIRDLRYKLSWVGIFNSPFKLPNISFYFGKIERGVPYFLPRKWVSYTYEEALDKTLEHFRKVQEVHERIGREYKIPILADYLLKLREYTRSKKAVSKKWGVDLVGHGWKTKFTQYRHEFNPMLSVVGFNRQFCIYVGLKGDGLVNDCYWEAWLYYKYETDKTLSKEERLKQVFEKYSCTWGNPDKGYTNYYYQILRKKYINLIPDKNN